MNLLELLATRNLLGGVPWPSAGHRKIERNFCRSKVTKVTASSEIELARVERTEGRAIIHCRRNCLLGHGGKDLFFM